jgi:hypothetical protein
MDYGKVSDILALIYADGVDLAGLDYLPADYWKECEDSLVLATFVSNGWVELTEMGKAQIEFAWRVLCEVRELDPEVMYDSPIAFFEAQAVEAEVVPIEKGKKK